MKDWIKILALTFTLFAGTAGALNYFAKDADLQLIASRLEQKIQGDELMYVQQELWMLEDRYRGKDCSTWPQDDKDRYRKLQMRKEQLQRELSK